MMNKVFESSSEALHDVFDGAVILCGGFGQVGGTPSTLFKALSQKPVKDLTLVGNAPALGIPFHKAASGRLRFPESFADGSLLVQNGQVRKLVVSVPALPFGKMKEPFPLVSALQAGQDIEIELVPQGTLAERIRAGKAGILAFYTPTGAGTFMEKGKDVKEHEGRRYLLEYRIRGDFALIWANKADRYGNLVYRGTSRTFNATMAGAAGTTIAEVDEIVDPGELDPETIVTPAVYVNRLVKR